MQSVRYVSTAAALGVAWFGVLLLPPPTRGFLLSYALACLVCLVLTSCIVALLFQDFIASARDGRQRIGRAVVLPYAGAAIFLVAISILAFGGIMEWPFYFWGAVYAVVAAPVVIPFGFVCQLVMGRAAQTR